MPPKAKTRVQAKAKKPQKAQPQPKQSAKAKKPQKAEPQPKQSARGRGKGSSADRGRGRGRGRCQRKPASAAPAEAAGSECESEPKIDPMTECIDKFLACLSAEEELRMKQFIASLPDLTLAVASGCSGSEVSRVGMQILGGKLGFKVDDKFSCESDGSKQSWIMKIIAPQVGDDDSCCFADVCDLKGEVSTCVKHDKKCVIRQPMLMYIGTSCKNMSKLNALSSQMGACLQQEVGTSGATCRGLLDFLSSHRPRIVIVENVEDILQDSHENQSYLYFALKDLGYESDGLIVGSEDYGSPQRRKRAYVIAFLKVPGAMQRVPQPAVAACALLRRLACGTLPVDRFLLDDDNPYLLAALALRQEKNEQNEETEPSAEVPSWKAKNLNILAKDGINVSSCVPPPEHRTSVPPLPPEKR